MQKINRDLVDFSSQVNVWREQTFDATAGQTSFKLSTSYPVNRNMIEVHLNGDKQRLNIDYAEFDENTIKFTEGLRSGDVVNLRWQVPFSEILISYPDIRIEEAKKVANVMKSQTFDVSGGQTEFSLPTPYEPGTHSIKVFVNGTKQRTGLDFTETDNETITMAEPLKGTDRVEIEWLAPSGQFLLGKVDIADAADESVPQSKIKGLTTMSESLDSLNDLAFTNGDRISVLEKNFISVIQTPFNAKGDGLTDDQQALVKAVDYAYLNNKTLYFPEGVYVSSASIPNFHKVRKVGTGKIQRGADLFYITPTAFQTNRIYLKATGGSNLNDGLSSSQPIAQLQTAVDILPYYANPTLGGVWEFSLSAGTFAKRVEVAEGLKSMNPIRFVGASVGGHPNVPTTIISEGAGKSAVGLLATMGTNVYVQDILFSGFNGSSSSCGVSVAYFSRVFTVNCHFTDCYYGVSGVHHTHTDVKGGIFTNCGSLSTGGGTGAGVRSLQINNHEIGTQNAGDNTKGPFFRNCVYGVYAQELSTGHADWCTFEDCQDAVIIRVMSRCNMDGSLFKRNQRALRGDGNSHFFISSNVQFATGVDKNIVTHTMNTGAQMTSSRIFGTQDISYGSVETSFDTVYVNQTFNAAANTAFYTETLNAPFFDYTPSSVAPIKKLRFKIFGTVTGTTDQKKITARLGNNYANAQFTASEQGAFVAEGYIYFVSNTEQFINMTANTHIGSNRSTNAKATNNMANNVTLTLEAYVFNSADSIKVEVVELHWAG